MAETKTKPTNESVKDFLNKISDEERRADCFQVAKIMEEVTGEKPKMGDRVLSASAVITTSTTAGVKVTGS